MGETPKMAGLPSMNSEMQTVFQQGVDFDEFEDFLRDCVKPLPVRIPSSFHIPPSNLQRGKPYFVHSELRCVMTKPGLHFPVELKGIQTGDVIRTSIQYNHEDHQGERVKCDGSNSGHQNVFEVVPRTAGLQAVPFSAYDNDPNLCSMTLINTECYGTTVAFRFLAKCLNSCSKVCPERILKFEHLSSDGVVLTTSNWALRVCSIPKRDFELMVASFDPVTGEKRKSLYSKSVPSKIIKLEQKELAPAENRESRSITKQELAEVNFAADLIATVSGSGTFDEPCTSRQTAINAEQVIHVYDANTSTPLIEEKVTPSYETVDEPSDEPPSPPFTRSPLYVQMNSSEDEDLVRRLIRRLNGTVHELRLTTP